MAKLIGILLVALVLEAVGVVLLSQGLKDLTPPNRVEVVELWRCVRSGLTNLPLLAGVGLEAAFFGLLLVMLKYWDVSLVWPLTSLGFVLTTLAARFIRHEDVSVMRWSGVILIVAGAILVGYSEKQRPTPSPQPLLLTDPPSRPLR